MREVDTLLWTENVLQPYLWVQFEQIDFQRERYYTFLKQAQLQNGLICLKEIDEKKSLD